MKTSNRERQRKWRQKQASIGMRMVTVMLPAEIKDLIDRQKKETGATMAQIIETAVVNLLVPPEDSSQSTAKTKLNQKVEEFPAEELHRIGTDLKAIVHLLETLTESKTSVSGNRKTVTNNASADSEAKNSASKEVYRLVRLLNNMEVSPEEIAFTLNKRNFKTLSGNAEWRIEDVHEVIKDIHLKYGHINPLFSITGNP
jgi:hypothetical protein